MNELPQPLIEPTIDLLFALADDKLLLGHRNSDWTGLAPMLEEDIAFSSMAQDEIAHALAVYELIALLCSATPRGETNADHLAFGRSPAEYRCAHIVEPSDDFDWSVALARKFFCDHFDAWRLARLSASSWTPLAQLAKRLLAEERVHVEHANGWLTRLARGDGEAARRLQAALDALAPLAAGLFEPTAGQDELEAAGIYPAVATLDGDTVSDVGATYRSTVISIGRAASLSFKIPPTSDEPGGRRGVHTPALAELLDEMCVVYRTEPEAAW